MENRAVKVLFEHLMVEAALYYGVRDAEYLWKVSNDWIKGTFSSNQRYAEMEEFIGLGIGYGTRILDMACGCGNFVFNGLNRGIDVRGIDPCEWKHRIIDLVMHEMPFPRKWAGQFDVGFGENLPYPDEHFDLVSTCQTLEHVGDVKKCVSEMLRVLKKGGTMFIRAPDYRGSYEKHYWLPWFPRHRKFTMAYLKAKKRPTIGYEILKEITLPEIKKYIYSLGYKTVDLDEEKVKKKLHFLPKKVASSCASLYKFSVLVKSRLFFKEMGMNLAVLKT